MKDEDVKALLVELTAARRVVEAARNAVDGADAGTMSGLIELGDTLYAYDAAVRGKPAPGDVRETDAPLTSCDWGSCDQPSVRERFDGEVWLPVCGGCSTKPYEREATVQPTKEAAAEPCPACGYYCNGDFCTHCGWVKRKGES